MSPNGTVTFVSDLYPLSVSDKETVLHSKVLQQFEPGDLILADKGFLLHDVIPQGVSVNIPPFLSRQQFTKPQVIETTHIARARIHVEHAIQRLKLYKILDFVPTYYRGKANKMFQLCVFCEPYSINYAKHLTCYLLSVQVVLMKLNYRMLLALIMPFCLYLYRLDLWTVVLHTEFF